MRRHTDYFTICPHCDSQMAVSLVMKLQASQREVSADCGPCQRRFAVHSEMIFSTELPVIGDRAAPRPVEPVGRLGESRFDSFFSSFPVRSEPAGVSRPEAPTRIPAPHPLTFTPAQQAFQPVFPAR